MNRTANYFAGTMKRCRRLLIALSAVTACSSSPAGEAANGDVVIAQGTSFGKCVGYCLTELVVARDSARLTQTSRDSVRYPRKTQIVAISDADWQRLQSLARPATLAQVEGTHGCPDCADGGAEWVELRTAERSIRATYEAGRDLAPIATLQAELRSIRQRFPEPPER